MGKLLVLETDQHPGHVDAQLLQTSQRLDFLGRQEFRDRHVPLPVMVLVQAHPPGRCPLDIKVRGALDTGEAAREHHVVDQQPGNSVVPLDEFVDEVEDLVFRLLDAVDVVLRKQGHDHPGVESRRLVDDAHRHGVAGVSLSQVRIGRQGPIGQRVEVETRKVRSVEKGRKFDCRDAR